MHAPHVPHLPTGALPDWITLLAPPNQLGLPTCLLVVGLQQPHHQDTRHLGVALSIPLRAQPAGGSLAAARVTTARGQPEHGRVGDAPFARMHCNACTRCAGMGGRCVNPRRRQAPDPQACPCTRALDAPVLHSPARWPFLPSASGANSALPQQQAGTSDHDLIRHLQAHQACTSRRWLSSPWRAASSLATTSAWECSSTSDPPRWRRSASSSLRRGSAPAAALFDQFNQKFGVSGAGQRASTLGSFVI